RALRELAAAGRLRVRGRDPAHLDRQVLEAEAARALRRLALAGGCLTGRRRTWETSRTREASDRKAPDRSTPQRIRTEKVRRAARKGCARRSRTACVHSCRSRPGPAALAARVAARRRSVHNERIGAWHRA